MGSTCYFLITGLSLMDAAAISNILNRLHQASTAVCLDGPLLTVCTLPMFCYFKNGFLHFKTFDILWGVNALGVKNKFKTDRNDYTLESLVLTKLTCRNTVSQNCRAIDSCLERFILA